VTTYVSEDVLEVVRVNELSLEVTWDYEEWCRQVPDWWKEPCGCRRTCDAGTLMNHLYKHNFIAWHELNHFMTTTIEGWVVRIKEGLSYLFPWPKKLYKKIKS
jgi:hypothetical protein